MGAVFRLPRRLWGDQRGSSLIEFALVLPPILLVATTILEVSAAMIAQQVLDTRTADAARMITKGGLDGLTVAAASDKIRATVCQGEVLPFLTGAACTSSLQVGVQAVVGGAAIPPAVTGGAINGAAFSVTATSGASVYLIRTGLTLPSMSAYWSSSLNNLSNGRRFIISGAIAKVDPYAKYDSTGSSPAPVF